MQTTPNAHSAATASGASVFPWPQAADYSFRDEHRTPLTPNWAPLNGSDLLLAFAGSAPAWVDALMAARNGVVGRLGLKTGPMPAALKGPLQVGQYLGMFQVHQLEADLALMGENDKHLDFRIFVRVDRTPLATLGAPELVVSTWVVGTGVLMTVALVRLTLRVPPVTGVNTKLCGLPLALGNSAALSASTPAWVLTSALTPSVETKVSPRRTPANAAGELGSTKATRRPRGGVGDPKYHSMP